MNDLARRAIDLWGAITRAYYARKYRALAKHLGRPPVPPEPERRPGFIIIEIDGLSHAHLRQALQLGYLPNLRGKIESGAARLHRWRCGVPSTTPAVQAGLLYGDNSDIPGFRWYDKASHTSFVVKRPDQVRALARRLSRAGCGLLRGGSSYTNLFDGDADLSLFTVSTVGQIHFFDNVRGLGFLLLFLLSPLRVGRVIWHSLREYAHDLRQRISSVFHPVREIPPHWLAPLFRVVVDVVFSEVVTFGMMLDMYRGVPSLYATFYAYDEMAHRFGPDHPEALRALRSIDAQIHQVDRMRQLYRRREYDLYVISDHGLSPSTSFQARYGQTLGQFILAQVGQPLELDEYSEMEAHTSDQAHFLLDELRVWETRRWRSARAARTVRRARNSLHQRIPPDLERAVRDPGRRGDIVVRPSGGLAHVYFNVAPRRLDLDEIAWAYPHLLPALLAQPAIGLIVGQADRHVMIMGKQGTLAVADGNCELRGDDPLCGLDAPTATWRELVELLGQQHSGDLILLGQWDEHGHVVTFEDQLGTHGGVGGPQEWPFVLAPAEVTLDAHALAGPRELYVHFMASYVTSNVERQHP